MWISGVPIALGLWGLTPTSPENRNAFSKQTINSQMKHQQSKVKYSEYNKNLKTKFYNNNNNYNINSK